jgi:hypothetical protein
MIYFRHISNQILQTASKCTVSLQPPHTSQLCITPVLCVSALSNYHITVP